MTKETHITLRAFQFLTKFWFSHDVNPGLLDESSVLLCPFVDFLLLDAIPAALPADEFTLKSLEKPGASLPAVNGYCPRPGQ